VSTVKPAPKKTRRKSGRRERDVLQPWHRFTVEELDSLQEYDDDLLRHALDIVVD